MRFERLLGRGFKIPTDPGMPMQEQISEKMYELLLHVQMVQLVLFQELTEIEREEVDQRLTELRRKNRRNVRVGLVIGASWPDPEQFLDWAESLL
jgi:predicted DNA-binding protein (UPF0278 family)